MRAAAKEYWKAAGSTDNHRVFTGRKREDRWVLFLKVFPVIAAFIAVIGALTVWLNKPRSENVDDYVHRVVSRALADQQAPRKVMVQKQIVQKEIIKEIHTKEPPVYVTTPTNQPAPHFDNAADNRRILAEAKEREIRCKWWKTHGIDYDLAVVRENIDQYCR